MKLQPPSQHDNSAMFIKNLLSDIQGQPEWRTEHALCEGYYDGLQLRPDIVAAMEERGQPVIINNLIQPTINGVLGMEAKGRSDWQVMADDDEGVLINEHLNERLNEEARTANADRAIADAFARQIKGGLGWVEVRRNDDPFGDKYIIDEVDWANVHWDWKSTRPDLKDARYLAVERWMDEDQAALISPKHADLIGHCLNGWPIADPKLAENLAPNLVGAWNNQRTAEMQDEEWLDYDRKRVRFFDVYYRRPHAGKVMIAGEQRVLFDPKNPLHRSLANAGHVKVVSARYYRMYRALFAGIHLIHDGPSPYPHNEFPLVPFFGFREGRSRVPYGLIRGMISPQNESNFRRSMLTWLLKARRIVMDEDATNMSDRELAAAVARVDGIIKLDPSRKNRDSSAFSIQSEIQIAGQQFNVMQDAEKQIQGVAGVYNAMLGRQDGGATSGIAINSLVEQGSVTMSELYDNYRGSKGMVGNLLLNLIAEDVGEEERKVKVYAKSDMRKTEELTLNQRTETGEVTNRLTMLGRRVVLADVQSTPGYRAQLLERLMALAATMPDPVKIVLLDSIIELTELPNRAELLKKLRKALGVGVEDADLDEEEKAALQKQQQLEQMNLAVEMAMKQAAQRQAEATASKTEAEAELAAAKITTEQQEPQLVAAKAQEILAKIKESQAQMVGEELERSLGAEQQIDELIDRMLAGVNQQGAPAQPVAPGQAQQPMQPVQPAQPSQPAGQEMPAQPQQPIEPQHY